MIRTAVSGHSVGDKAPTRMPTECSKVDPVAMVLSLVIVVKERGNQRI